MNAFISVAALIVGFAQIVFLFNLVWSLFKGGPAGSNPWRSTTLEWQTPETPPGHGNWGKELPVVYRWAYDYSVPGPSRASCRKTSPRSPGRLGRGHGRDHTLRRDAGGRIVWWLSTQRLTAKPWLEEGPIGEFPGTNALFLPAAKIGLGLLPSLAHCLH